MNQKLGYRPKTFDLDTSGTWRDATPEQSGSESRIAPYLFSDKIAIAVDVALVTNRPLLVSGPPGSGKTSLAPVMAKILDWEFLSHTLTSRSRLEDLTGDIDQLRRLSHAQVGEAQLRPEWAYQKPGLFWWAFDPDSAARRGGSEDEFNALQKQYNETKLAGRPGEKAGVVVLLDEIDKAEPDLPNDLLEPLDNRSFAPPVTTKVHAPANSKLLVVITTNQERDLPRAFIRRCVILDLAEEDDDHKVAKLADRMQSIAQARYADSPEITPDPDTVTRLATIFAENYFKAKQKQQRLPGTSEFLDTVEACSRLGFSPAHKRWQQIIDAAMIKDFKN